MHKTEAKARRVVPRFFIVQDISKIHRVTSRNFVLWDFGVFL